MKKQLISLGFIALAFIGFTQGTGYIGISMEKAPNKGVRIAEVLENGAAQTYNLKQNDVIFSINGVQVNTAKQLKDQVKSKNWGETITVVYDRNGHSHTQKVTLGSRVEKVTYHVKRKVIENGFEWNFDKKVFITIENGTPVKMVKVNDDNSFSELIIVEGGVIPQRFSDFDDKMEIIEKIEEKNAGKKRFPSITVYIKTYPLVPKKKEVSTQNPNADLTVFPNPSLGEFQFSFSVENSSNSTVTWQVFDVTGKEVLNGKLADFEGKTNQKLNLTPQGAGTYLLRILHDTGVHIKRLVVK